MNVLTSLNKVGMVHKSIDYLTWHLLISRDIIINLNQLN